MPRPWLATVGGVAAAAAPPSGQQQQQQYFRSDSSDSAARMLPGEAEAEAEAEAAGRRKKRCSPAWLAVAAMGILALQIASTTGLFVYFTMAVSKLKGQAQGNSEELTCLLLFNRMQALSDLDELGGSQACRKLAGNIKAYIAMVTENVIHKNPHRANITGEQLVSRQTGSKASAHITLRRKGSAQPGSLTRFGELQQSCLHPVRYWANRTMHSHLQNFTYQDGLLQVSQPGKYYVYAQIYFRYPTEETSPRAPTHQLVQCINLHSSYGQTILLLKGVGTKCWAQGAAYGLQALYQGGVFDLKAGDALSVSVSSLDIDYDDETASYFGAFRLDV